MDTARRQHEQCALVTLARIERYAQAAREAILSGSPSITHPRTLAEAVQRLTEDVTALLTIDLAAAKDRAARAA